MARAQSSASRFITLIFIAVALIVAWFVAPLILPMYRWLYVDFARIAAEARARGHQVTAESVARQFEVEFGYLPRGEGDPRPWVLLKMTPPWSEVAPENADEERVALRCTVIGDRTGTPVSSFLLGANNFKDRFFRAKAWRLPPGSLGLDSERPIILYDAMSLEKLGIATAETLNWELSRSTGGWELDDDGWVKPE